MLENELPCTSRNLAGSNPGSVCSQFLFLPERSQLASYLAAAIALLTFFFLCGIGARTVVNQLPGELVVRVGREGAAGVQHAFNNKVADDIGINFFRLFFIRIFDFYSLTEVVLNTSGVVKRQLLNCMFWLTHLSDTYSVINYGLS